MFTGNKYKKGRSLKYIHKCDNCGKQYILTPGLHFKRIKRSFCSRSCSDIFHRGPRHHLWKNERKYEYGGYVLIKDPRITTCARYILEHRYVMEKHLGRKLTTTETVHHINGIKNDNSIANLELRQKDHGQGLTKYTEDINNLLIENMKLYKHFIELRTKAKKIGIRYEDFPSYNKTNPSTVD